MTVVVVVGATVVGGVVVVTTAGAIVVVATGSTLSSSFPRALAPTAMPKVIPIMGKRSLSGCFMCLQCLADTAGDFVSLRMSRSPCYHPNITI